ncbi:calcium/calmodulin-dependent 3',5'-cyclic nucleotide phosphodiesterase 1C-like protein [Lates japonicus]|uniref:Calcium/calmodulin-dependent 3',5'-cyclic nucleotide phosphodiesterase 1C-like protein n=1 Tax=Lates japonicus TaxID=270547 RepID=A0AAD3MIT7_LATJO|nr:calcium/calmodulin-dependent 3',5'-cyclic nucleotide phosphodiesterase 1C-like protein [Lates japonicus]
MVTESRWILVDDPDHLEVLDGFKLSSPGHGPGEEINIEDHFRMYRRTSNMTGFSYPPNVITVLKHVDMWSFDVFALNDASGDHALKFVFYELLTRYDLINRFKLDLTIWLSPHFCPHIIVDSLEVGYSKYKNPYNLMHASQTIHYFLLTLAWCTGQLELEIFAIIFAAAIHDFEHTGTTNNFHIQTE